MTTREDLVTAGAAALLKAEQTNGFEDSIAWATIGIGYALLAGQVDDVHAGDVEVLCNSVLEPFAGNPAKRCELLKGHEFGHQASDGTQWTHLPCCDDEECDLYAGHPGRHYSTTAGRAFR